MDESIGAAQEPTGFQTGNKPASDLPRQVRFVPGGAAGPGRPKGSRHAALVALDAIGEEGAAEVLRKVVEQATAGDARCAEILLRRVWPERKGRPVAIELPPLATPADVTQATAAIVAAVAEGMVTPDEGAAVASIVETHRRAIETEELERRLAALEAAQPAGGRR